MINPDLLITKYVLSGERHNPEEIISALSPIADVDHIQLPWVWKTIADAAEKVGDIDLFLHFSQKFIFSSQTQRADYRVGKLAMVIDRIKYLRDRSMQFGPELDEFRSLAPSEFDFIKLSQIGVEVSGPDIVTFDADTTIVADMPGGRAEAPVTVIGGRHFAAKLSPPISPTIRIVSHVDYIVVGSDTCAARSDGRFYRHLSRSETARRAYDSLSGQTPSRNLEGTSAALNDYFTVSNYCHWMLDWFPRLLLARQYVGEIDYVLTRNARTRFELETLDVAGIDSTRILVDTDGAHYRVERLVTVDNTDIARTHPVWSGNSAVIDLVRNAILPSDRRTGNTGRRIYISRRDVGSRVVVNQQEVDDLLSEFGVETVDLTGLSVRAQADLFSQCSLLIGVHGAGLTNMLFMPPNSTVLELFHYKYGSVSYSHLARGCGHHYAYLSCDSVAGSDLPTSSPAEHNSTSFISADIWVEVPTLRRALHDLTSSR